MRINGALYRRLRVPDVPVNVHLGPGKDKYLPGWVNLDANLLTAKIDVWANLQDPLPFRACTVRAFYSHHVIEHLPDSFLSEHFSEMYRCLVPGGVIRLGGPNGDAAMQKFVEGDAAWFHDYPDRRESIGGKLANFLLCRGQHLTILTRSYLTELAEQAGFTDVRQCIPQTQTYHPDVFDDDVLGSEGWEGTEAPYTLVIEARKPKPDDGS